MYLFSFEWLLHGFLFSICCFSYFSECRLEFLRVFRTTIFVISFNFFHWLISYILHSVIINHTNHNLAIIPFPCCCFFVDSDPEECTSAASSAEEKESFLWQQSTHRFNYFIGVNVCIIIIDFYDLLIFCKDSSHIVRIINSGWWQVYRFLSNEIVWNDIKYWTYYHTLVTSTITTTTTTTTTAAAAAAVAAITITLLVLLHNIYFYC